MQQSAIAAALGVSKSQITRYKKMGAPIDQGIDAVVAWRDANIEFRSRDDVIRYDGSTIRPLRIKWVRVG